MPERKDHDLDILAYADRFLDKDPQRKACFEARMRASPELASRVRAYEAQSEGLRLAYAGQLNEPVPERLLAALEAGGPHRSRAFAKAAVMLLLIASASVLGWLVGRSHQPADELAYDFVERSYHEYVSTGAKPHLPSGGQVQPLNLAADRISLSLHVPDLSHLGYDLVDKQTITGGAQTMVRLTYATSDREDFSLFLHPRSEGADHDVDLKTERGVSVAHWAEGPLAAVVATRLPPDETLAVARSIRAVLADPSLSQPMMQTTPAARQGDLVTGLPVQDETRRNNPLLTPPTAPRAPNAFHN
jgi:anti-sigma factor RsiW